MFSRSGICDDANAWIAYAEIARNQANSASGAEVSTPRISRRGLDRGRGSPSNGEPDTPRKSR